MGCPVCGGSSTGKVGVDQYYCWNCFIEFSMKNDEIHVFQVAEDGSLLECTEGEEMLNAPIT